MLTSIVLPIHDEEQNIFKLLHELREVMQHWGEPWEVICVNDGSTDCTAAILSELLTEMPLRILTLGNRCGQSAALWFGLAYANGDYIVTMDADGQNDPRDIPHLLIRLQEEGCDLVVGHRQLRFDPLRKRLFSSAANRVRKWLTGSSVPDSGCGLKAFRSEAIADLLPLQGMHRFLSTMMEISGRRVVSVAVKHRARTGGKSKYGVLDRLWLPFVDCLSLAWLRHRRLPEEVLCSSVRRDRKGFKCETSYVHHLRTTTKLDVTQ